MADETPGEAVGPWTVKGVPAEARAEINRAAKRADQTVGEWLQAAARLAIQAERQGPPGPAPVEEQGPPPAYVARNMGAALEAVERLTAVLPGLTTEDGKLADLARKVIKQNLTLLDVASRPPKGPPRGSARLAAPKG